MKIGLLGAPGSGKTELADSLGALGRVYVIDRYVEALSVKTDTAFGHFSTYAGNMLVASERLRQEWHGQAIVSTMPEVPDEHQYKHRVTCGTMIETILYNTLWGMMAKEVGITPRADLARMALANNLLAQMLRDTWDYDLLLRLSYPEEKRAQEDGSQNALLDEWLPVTLRAFSLDCYELRHGHHFEDASNWIETHEHNAVKTHIE